MTRARKQRLLTIPRAVFAAAVILAGGGFAPLGPGPAPTAGFCSVDPPIEFSARRTRRIVREAAVLVRATAIGRADAPPGSEWTDGYFVSFAVIEVIKGSPPSDTLVFRGGLEDRDSFREGEDAAVPYLSYHRRYAGDCIASVYRPGGEYLLLLNRRGPDEPLDPYWEILAPTNEQIRGPRDPWVTWVRKTLAGNG